MPELVPKPQSVVAQARLDDALDKARALAKKARADATRRAYASDCRQFEAYCASVETKDA